MKKIALTAILAATTASIALADITVNFSQVPENDTVIGYRIPISALTKSRAERRAANVTDTLKIVNKKLTLADPAAPSQYSIAVGNDDNIQFFAAPGENIVIDVKSTNPLEYTLKGSQLVEGIQSMNDLSAPIVKQIMAARQQEKTDEALMDSLFKSYYKVFSDFAAANPDNAATPYALLNMEGEDMLNAVDNLTQAARASIVMPIVEAQYNSVKQRIEQQKKQEALQSGDVDAPAFTLKNLEGKDVSVADFKGKWVILDFWGTWCPWCIKGFPALKEAYAKYNGKLEVIGVDCGDTEDVWRKGVEKYELPWVQVYNPKDSKVTDEYYVTGFPTKVIINPQGKIANITVGEDPKFFEILAKFIGE